MGKINGRVEEYKQGNKTTATCYIYEFYFVISKV